MTEDAGKVKHVLAQNEVASGGSEQKLSVCSDRSCVDVRKEARIPVGINHILGQNKTFAELLEGMLGVVGSDVKGGNTHMKAIGLLVQLINEIRNACREGQLKF
jgi:hypothetical protein